MTCFPSLKGMEAMRSTWTDSRLDKLNGQVGGLSCRVDELGRQVDWMREDVRDLRGEVGALKRAIIQVGGGLVGTLLVGMLGLIATQI